jgi:hypothetical protein
MTDERQAALTAAFPWYGPHQQWLKDQTTGQQAVLIRADLGWANLRGANLGEANLRGANLRGANLGEANLRGANLRGATLRWATLRGATLGWANLGEADLRGANLRGANLRGATLGWANLGEADLREANLRGATLGGATLPDGVPVVPDLDAAILTALAAGGALDMSAWHRCKTTHCRAGWAITLAGAAGAALETQYGSACAGALIYAASDPWRPVPDFHAGDDEALADLRRRAGVGGRS